MTALPARTGAGSLTDAATTNAQQKANLGDLRDFLADLFGTDSTLQTALAVLAPAWATSTPTPTPGAGAFTSASCSMRTRQIGKVVHVAGSVTVTTVGTATGHIAIPLPVTQKTSVVDMGVWRENLVDGVVGAVYATGSTAYLFRYDNAAFLASGRRYDFSLTYEGA